MTAGMIYDRKSVSVTFHINRLKEKTYDYLNANLQYNKKKKIMATWNRMGLP